MDPYMSPYIDTVQIKVCINKKKLSIRSYSKSQMESNKRLAVVHENRICK